MRYKTLLITLLAVLISLNNGNSQVTLRAKSVFKKQTNFNFTNDWHYLTTDLYLFNADKFDLLLNEVYNIQKGKKRHRRKKGKLAGEQIRNIFITIKIQGTAFGDELTYPIYNFKVENVEGKYKTYTSTNYEVIRIIDNLPLSQTKGFVDALLNIDVLTDRNLNKVYELIADQLQNISKIPTPSNAIMTLVGEFGKVLKNNAKGKAYHFKETIRLYEEQDFNKRFHSLALYVFMPSDRKVPGLDTNRLAKFIDTVPNPKITEQQLGKLVDYKKYPYIIIVNYKSRYVSEPVVGDEVTFESIEARKLKKRKAYDAGLISRETYLQEMKLIEFLETFVQLKLDINNYKLNYNNKITDDFSNSFFIILKEYRKLKNLYANRVKEFGGNSGFETQFKPIYESILLNAELYLENDINLKNIKELVNTVYEFENTPNLSLDSASREEALRKLYSVQLPDDDQASVEMAELNKWIDRIEKEQYRYVFRDKVAKIKALKPTDENQKIIDKAKNMVKTTNCRYCRKQVNEAISEFNEKRIIQKKQKLLQQRDTLTRKAKDLMFYILVEEACMNKHFSNDYPDGMPPHIQLLYEDFNQMKQKRKLLKERINEDVYNLTVTKIAQANSEIEVLMKSIKELHDGICNKVNDLCVCNQNTEKQKTYEEIENDTINETKDTSNVENRINN